MARAEVRALQVKTVVVPPCSTEMYGFLVVAKQAETTSRMDLNGIQSR